MVQNPLQFTLNISENLLHSAEYSSSQPMTFITEKIEHLKEKGSLCTFIQQQLDNVCFRPSGSSSILHTGVTSWLSDFCCQIHRHVSFYNAGENNTCSGLCSSNLKSMENSLIHRHRITYFQRENKKYPATLKFCTVKPFFSKSNVNSSFL